MHAVLVRRKFGALTVALCLAGCSGQAPAPPPTAAQASSPAEPQPAKVNIDEIFPAGRGRELLLNNCTSCHTFVPIVVLQMSKDAWQRNSRDHRGRVGGLSDADFAILYQYLIANFNPERPVPKLPKELLDTWTSY